MKKSNLFKIVNGVKVYASFYKELKKDENGNLYEGSSGGYFVEDAQGGTMLLYWDIAVIYAEFISYGLTPREAWEAVCAFFDDPDHARVNYVPGLIIDTCLNKGRAAAVIEAREAAANVSEEKETAEEITAAKVLTTAARLLATVKDHAAKVANRIGCKARRFGAASLLLLARILFFAVGTCSALGFMLGAALVIPEITPNGVAACLLIRVPIMFAVVGLWAFVWCWSLHHIMPARLLDYIQYGNR